MTTEAPDPLVAMTATALSFEDVGSGTSCNQTAFTVGKGKFLFLGPGPKGKRCKAMFKLKASMPEAEALAASAPERFEVGKTGWVTARFSAAEPMPQDLWTRWLTESYEITRK
ncbi:MAG: MmcQ/YjbR family DNA-binding protein [Pseudomonadota bacterium]